MIYPTRPLFRTLLLLGLFCCGNIVSKACNCEKIAQGAQESTARQDETKVDEAKLASDPASELALVSRLLDEAENSRASDKTIQKLRCKKAKLIFAVGRSDKSRSILETLDPVIADPTGLIQEFGDSQSYLEAVQLFCAALADEGEEEKVQEALSQAIEDLDAGMALTERERFQLTTQLRLFGSRQAPEKKRFEQAINWISPIFDRIDWLVEDANGAEILCEVTCRQSFCLSELKRMDECDSIVQLAVKKIDASDLEESWKLEIIAKILSRHLLNDARYFIWPPTTNVWQEAQDHWRRLESYRGPRLIELQSSGLEIGLRSISHLGLTDFDKSTKVIEQMMKQFDRHPELVVDEAARQRVFSASFSFFGILKQSGDKRADTEYDRIMGFLQKIKELGADEAWITKKMSVMDKNR